MCVIEIVRNEILVGQIRKEAGAIAKVRAFLGEGKFGNNRAFVWSYDVTIAHLQTLRYEPPRDL